MNVFKGRKQTQTLALGAMCIALAFLLSFVGYSFPQGGSVTLFSMLPIMAFSYAFGTLPGLIVGLGYGILQFIQKPYFIGIFPFLLDYIVAFSCLGFAGVFRKLDNKYLGLLLGILLAGMLRMSASTLSGVLFYGEYAGDQNVFIYSFVYNFSTIGLDTILCAVGAAVPAVNKLITGLRLKKSA